MVHIILKRVSKLIINLHIYFGFPAIITQRWNFLFNNVYLKTVHSYSLVVIYYSNITVANHYVGTRSLVNIGPYIIVFRQIMFSLIYLKTTGV